MASGLIRKIFDLSLWNTTAAGINFIANILIAKVLGVSVFGEFAYLVSLVSLFSLIFILLPPNYSIIRYQDEPEFKYIIAAFFIVFNGFLLIPVFAFQHLIPVPFWLFYIFCFSSCFQAYFDISLQAENKLKNYYFLIFIQAVAKILAVGIFLAIGYIVDFYTLILVISISQLGVTGVYIYRRREIFMHSMSYFGRVFLTIRREIKAFYPYYFNISLKKLDSNIIILLFEPLVSKEILGIYSLLTKVFQFVSGLVRTVESIFLFRQNIKKYYASFVKNAFYIGMVLQFGMIITGLFYMKFISGNYYLVYLCWISLLLYPYVFFIESRAFFLTLYKNFHINVSYFLFLLPPAIVFLTRYLTRSFPGLHDLIISLFAGSVLQMFYLIFMARFFRKRYPEISDFTVKTTEISDLKQD